METETRGDRAKVASNVAAFCILAAPAIYAVMTFEHPFVMNPMRTFGLPLVIVELIVIALAAWSGFRPWRALAAIPKGISIALAVWLAVGLANAAISPYPVWNTTFFGLLLVHLIFAIALFDRLHGPWHHARKRMLVAVAAGVALFAIVLHVQLLIAWDIPDFNWKNIGGGVIHVRHISFYGIALVGVSLGFLLTTSDSRTRAMAFAGLFIGFYLCAFSGGRNPFAVSILGSLLLVLVLAGEGRLRLALATLATAAVAMPITFLTVPPNHFYGLDAIITRFDFETGNAMQTVTGRWSIWQDTFWAAMTERPLIGHGRGSFVHEIRNNSFHPHNLPLQLLYNWGVIGSAALFFLFVSGAARARDWLQADRATALPGLCPVVLLFLLSGVDGPFFFAYTLMILAIFVAVLASTKRATSSQVSLP